MAVSFKVPKSPSKDIFDIGTFLGVDLTNSGADMDERRSPNAENMVRYVPGKVRKRTGYKKDILFAPNTNVNIAVGTSANDEVIDFATSEIDTTKHLYDCVLDLEDYVNLYLEFDYKAPRYFSIKVGNLTRLVDPSVEWNHFSGRIEMNPGTDFGITSSYAQEIHIKNFSAMLDKDSNYVWSPAPNNYVERETLDPVYGCHIGKVKSDYEGNRVVNVNRALETSSETRTISATSTEQTIYQLGEAPVEGCKMYVEFDISMQYEAGNNWTYISIGGYTYRITNYEIERHISYVENIGYAADKNVKLRMDGTGTVYIRNLSIMYDKNDDYVWSPAPEDNGGTFPIEDIYYIGNKNYAVVDSISKASSPASGQSWVQQQIFLFDDPLSIYEVEFDISTSSEKSVNAVTLTIYDTAGNTLYGVQVEGNHFNKKHIKCFGTSGAPTTCYANIMFNLGFDNLGECTTKITNLKVYEATARQDYYKSSIWSIYHVGDEFYSRAHNSKEIVSVFQGANKHISRAWQLNKCLYIIDGSDIYMWTVGKGIFESIGRTNAYIPKVTIAKEPSGGGTSYEPFNLLQPGFYELFQGQSGTKDYQLTFGNLDDTPVSVWVLNQSGSWDRKYEDSDFSVNRSLGKITFVTAPGASPITGEDNIKVLAYRTIEDYRERITKCTHGALYGIGGAGDRLFLAGNPDHPNWDFYSEQYDPTYFPDTNYATLGSEQSMITGYAVVNNYLATFKDGFDQSQSVFVREGDLLKTDEGDEEGQGATTEPVFKLINTLQGVGVIAPYTFGYIQTEPLFLSKAGIYAITEQDITGEKYTQNRSFYLDGKLRKELNPENAMACIYDNQYILALNNQLYILDGLQATRTDKSEPYATRQYAGFYCTNVPALCIWEDDGVWFGTNDGKVCAFNTDIESLASYNDDGKAIYSCWETPDLDGKLFYKNKTFRYFAVRLMSAIKTSAKLYSRKLGVWNFIREETVIGNPIDFANFDFELFTFSQDTTEKVLHTKVRVKKVDKARFRVENDKYNEPFGLFDLALEYIESGNYKG